MKTLKKSLCFVLAVVMAVGTLVVSAAAFKDDEEITASGYEEAITVLSGLKILNGYEDGTFHPENELTRAQAAKIVATIMLTPDQVEKKLTVAPTTGLSDIDNADGINGNSHWAAKYVDYLVGEGVLAANGMGDGKFHPEEPLTGTALAKMLLVALGFDAKRYEGVGWEVNVRSDAREANITTGMVINLNKNINRGEACQLALNAMKYTPDEDPETIWYVVCLTNDGTLGGYNSAIEASVMKDIFANQGHKGHTLTIQPQTYYTGSMLHDTYKVRYSSSYENETTGEKFVEYFRWTDNKSLYYKPLGDGATLTYTTETKSKQIYADLVSKCGITSAIEWKNVTRTVDGFPETKINITPATNNDDGDFVVNPKGATTRVYYNSNDGTVKIVTDNRYLAEVVGVDAYKAPSGTNTEVKAGIWIQLIDTTKPNVNVVVDGKSESVQNTKFKFARKIEGDFTFAKGDYILTTIGYDASKAYLGDVCYTVSKDTIIIPGVVTGKVTSYHEGNRTLTVNGQTYQIAAVNNIYADNNKTFNTDFKTDNFFNTTFNFFVDDAGYIYGYKIVNAEYVEPKFAYVLDYQFSTGKGSDGNLLDPTAGSTEAAAKARLMFTDGTVKVVDLDMYLRGSTVYSKSYGVLANGGTDLVQNTNNVHAKKWVQYSVENDVYTLAELTTAGNDITTANVIEIKTKDLIASASHDSLGQKYLNTKTVAVALNANATAKGTAPNQTYSYTNSPIRTVATGFQNIKINAGSKVLVVVNKNGVDIDYIYFATDTTGATVKYDGDTLAADKFYYVNSIGDNTADGTIVEFFVNGEVVQMVVTDTDVTTKLTKGKAYKFTNDASFVNGVLTIGSSGIDGTRTVNVNADGATSVKVLSFDSKNVVYDENGTKKVQPLKDDVKIIDITNGGVVTSLTVEDQIVIVKAADTTDASGTVVAKADVIYIVKHK